MRLPVVVAALALAGHALAAQPCPGIVHKQIKVSGRNDEWTNADLKIKPTDLVIVRASGKVKVGEFTGEVDANGAPGQEFGRLAGC